MFDDTEELCVGKGETLRYLTGVTCDDNSLCQIIFPIFGWIYNLYNVYFESISVYISHECIYIHKLYLDTL